MLQITEITRGYKSAADRKRAVTMMRKHGFNYFVSYRDTQAEFALCYGNAEWVASGSFYWDR